MGRFLDRALNAVLGDVEESVRRDVERVKAEARSMTPLNRGKMKQSLPPLGSGQITQVTRGGVTAQFDQGEMHVPHDVQYPPDEERYLMRNAAGETVIDELRPAPTDIDWLKVEARPGLLTVPVSIDPDLLKEEWEGSDDGFTGTLKRMARDAAELDVEKELHIRRFHRCGGYHEEPVTISTGETVAWLCRNCDYVRYAEGW